MRYIYNTLFYLLLPILLVRLLWRSLRQKEYRYRIAERYGFYPVALEGSIWVHAVSVGETLAAIPLIKNLQKLFPNIPLVVTTMTPTGAARVKSAFSDSVIHLYIPYDFSGGVKRFLRAIKPKIAIIMETELWPNLLYYSHQFGVPICLVNARLSEKSAAGYQRIAGLTQEMLQKIDVIAAHGDKDADRFVKLGANEKRVHTTGNIKFDIHIPETLKQTGDKLREELGQNRFIWIAASTHEGEEEIILAAHKELVAHNPQALLILVPRHPNRFDAVAKLSAASFTTCRRSKNEIPDANTQVYVGDTMGELLLLYSACDVAFVGGSLISLGGHNILEAAALAKPILTGKSLYNFLEISQKFIDAAAMVTIKDSKELYAQLQALQNTSQRLQVGERALAVMAENRGALNKQIDLIKQISYHHGIIGT